MRIAVAGGTGVVGRYVVGAIDSKVHDSVVLARSRGVDLTTGTGLDAALEGVDAVIDVANVSTMKAAESAAWFELVTTHLLEACARAKVAHLVALSIVGVDRVDLGYYFGKRKQEDLLLTNESAVATSVLRATQFHEFAGQLLRNSNRPLVLLPRLVGTAAPARSRCHSSRR